jgi:hypothetical protein
MKSNTKSSKIELEMADFSGKSGTGTEAKDSHGMGGKQSTIGILWKQMTGKM